MFKKSLIAAALAVAATGSFAQAYVQGAVGQGTVNADWTGTGMTTTKNSSTGSKFVAGYGLGNGWSVEANVINYGKAVGNGTTGGYELKATGMGFGGAYTGAIDKLTWRVGLAMNQNKLSASASGTATLAKPSETSSQLNTDFGIGYRLTDNLAAIAGYDKSTVKINTVSFGTSLVSVGLRANF